MDVNPFAVVEQKPLLQESLTAVKEPGQTTGSGSKASGMEELQDVVQRFQRSASRSVTSHKSRVLNRIVELGRSLFQKLTSYAKTAVELAVHKFVVELCAMVISAVFAALSRKGYGGMDISTKDVFYRQPGAAAQPASSGAFVGGSSQVRNPFESWASAPRSASAW